MSAIKMLFDECKIIAAEEIPGVVEINDQLGIWVADAEKELIAIEIDNTRLKALVDEISVLITQFKKARNTTGSIDAIAKIVVWNVEQEDRIGKEKRDAGEVV